MTVAIASGRPYGAQAEEVDHSQRFMNSQALLLLSECTASTCGWHLPPSSVSTQNRQWVQIVIVPPSLKSPRPASCTRLQGGESLDCSFATQAAATATAATADGACSSTGYRLPAKSYPSFFSLLQPGAISRACMHAPVF
jgi:hypothetical protein